MPEPQPTGPMADVHGVIFDLDDTLFDHRGAVDHALSLWLPTLGLTPDQSTRTLWNELEERHWARLRAGMATFIGQRRARVHEFLTTLTPTAPAPRDHQRLDALFAEFLAAYRQGWSAFPDAAPVVADLRRRGVAVVVLTNGQHDEQAAKLEAIGLGQLVGSLVSADRIAATKPDPRAYRAAVERSGIPSQHLLHVGDRPDLDVEAPMSVGLRGLLVDRANRYPDYPGCIATLSELTGANLSPSARHPTSHPIGDQCQGCG